MAVVPRNESLDSGAVRSAGRQITERARRREEEIAHPQSPQAPVRSNRVQLNQDDGDRVELSSESRQHLEANSAAALNKAAAGLPSPLASRLGIDPLDPGSEADKAGANSVNSSNGINLQENFNSNRVRSQNLQLQPEKADFNRPQERNPQLQIKSPGDDPSGQDFFNRPEARNSQLKTEPTESPSLEPIQSNRASGNLTAAESTARLKQGGPVDSDADYGGAVTRNQFNEGLPDARQAGGDFQAVTRITSNDQAIRGKPDTRITGSRAIRAEERDTNVGDQVIRQNPDPRHAGNDAGKIAASQSATGATQREGRPSTGRMDFEPIEPAAGDAVDQSLRARQNYRAAFESVAQEGFQVKDAQNAAEQESNNLREALRPAPEVADSARGSVVEPVVKSTGGGAIAQKFRETDTRGEVEVESAPTRNFIQQNIDINSRTSPSSQGSAYPGPSGQNPIAQQIRQNANPEPVASNPRLALAGQNPAEETVRFNEGKVAQINELSRTDRASVQEFAQARSDARRSGVRDQQAEVARQADARLRPERQISPDVNSIRAEAAGNSRATPKQDVNTALNEARQIRQADLEARRARGEAAVLPTNAEEPVLDIPKQDIAALQINDTRPPTTPRDLAHAFVERAQAPTDKRVQERANTQNVHLEQNRREIAGEENRNRNPVAEQTQIGRNVDRLV